MLKGRQSIHTSILVSNSLTLAFTILFLTYSIVPALRNNRSVLVDWIVVPSIITLSTALSAFLARKHLKPSIYLQASLAGSLLAAQLFAATQIPVPALFYICLATGALLNPIALHRRPDTSMILNSSYLGSALLTRCLSLLLPQRRQTTSPPFPNEFTSSAMLASGARDYLPWEYYVFLVVGVIGGTALAAWWQNR